MSPLRDTYSAGIAAKLCWSENASLALSEARMANASFLNLFLYGSRLLVSGLFSIIILLKLLVASLTTSVGIFCDYCLKN